MRVLVFGDSITQGYWAVEHGWVDRLRKYYDTRQFQDLRGRDEPTVFNLGISADTSFDVMQRVESEVIARTRPHHAQKPVVIIQIGINDSSLESGRYRVPVDQYRKNLIDIVRKIESHVSQVIFVGFSAGNDAQTAPVFWNDQISYRNTDIRMYEQEMAKVANELPINFIPVFDTFKEALDRGEDLLPDGLHPNDAGHELIYQAVKPKLEEIIL